MIKNEALDIKMIFKTYLITLKTGQKHFKSQTNIYSIKHQKTVFFFLEVKAIIKETLENSFQKLFSKTIFLNYF